MNQFSIRMLLLSIAFISMVLAIFGLIAKVRSQQVDIRNFEQALEESDDDLQIFGNTIMQCETDPQLSVLDMSSYLESLAGNEFQVRTKLIETTVPDSDNILLVMIRGRGPGSEYIGNTEYEGSIKCALVIYNLDQQKVIDVMKTKRYQRLSLCADGFELNFGDAASTVIATVDGFVEVE